MSESEEGLTIVASPVQLAAILAGESIGAEANVTNRVWGTFRTLGGVLELVGASALCLAPDPTGVTKAGCVFMGVHGSDVVSSGLHEVWTGRSTETLTAQGTNKAAGELGASSSTASTIALVIDVGVPALFTAQVGALRIQAIRSGKFSLRDHEKFHAASKGGGHTILEHVGKSEAQLRARLADLALTGKLPEAVSSFKDLNTAERAVGEVLRRNAQAIQAWAKVSANHGKNLALPIHDIERVIGHGVIRSTGKLERIRKVRVVLKYKTYNNMPYYVLTAFPVP